MSEEQLRNEIKKAKSTIKWIRVNPLGFEKDDQETRIEKLKGYVEKLENDLHHLTSDNHELF